MTLITFKDGKPVVRDGKVGAAQACCCGCYACVKDGQVYCQYTTKAACEDCARTYQCYEVVQTQCDGTCPSGFGDTPEYVAPIIITHEGYGCWGWGSYYGEAEAVIGCGEILSATITSQSGQLARLGRVAPTITATLHISEGSGAVLGVTLEQSTDDCGRKVWSVVAVNVIDGGSGYVSDYTAYISFETAAGDSADFGGIAYPEVDETGAIVNVYVENGGQYYREDPSATPDVASPTITIDDGLFGSGAVITPNIDTNTSSPTFGEITSLTVEDGGSGYRSLCSRTTEVTSCEDCPSHGPAPEFSSCTQTSAVGACGTWQQVDCDETTPCPPCPMPPPNCFGLSFVCAHITGTITCAGIPNRCNIPEPFSIGDIFLFAVSGTGFIYNSPTAAVSLACIDGNWRFEYFGNPAQGNIYFVAHLGPACDRENPCDVEGLSGTGTIAWILNYTNVNGAPDPECWCTGTTTGSVTISSEPCSPC